MYRDAREREPELFNLTPPATGHKKVITPQLLRETFSQHILITYDKIYRKSYLPSTYTVKQLLSGLESFELICADAHVDALVYLLYTCPP